MTAEQWAEELLKKLHCIPASAWPLVTAELIQQVMAGEREGCARLVERYVSGSPYSGSEAFMQFMETAEKWFSERQDAMANNCRQAGMTHEEKKAEFIAGRRVRRDPRLIVGYVQQGRFFCTCEPGVEMFDMCKGCFLNALAGEVKRLREMGLTLLGEWKDLEAGNWRNPKHPDFVAEYERRRKEWVDVVPGGLPSARTSLADRQSQVSPARLGSREE